MGLSSVVGLANSRISLAFDRRSGRLLRLTNRETGGECLQERAAGGNLFAVYHDFIGLFDITADRAGTPCVASHPAEITRSVFAPGDAETVEWRRSRTAAGERLGISYRGRRWRALLTLSLPREGVTVRAAP